VIDQLVRTTQSRILFQKQDQIAEIPGTQTFVSMPFSTTAFVLSRNCYQFITTTSTQAYFQQTAQRLALLTPHVSARKHSLLQKLQYFIIIIIIITYCNWAFTRWQ
jgi:hypothetical protein